MSSASQPHRLHHVQVPGHRAQRYESPTSLEQALELLDRHGDDARLIAGGTDLLVEFDRGMSTPPIVIDLTRIAGLDSITQVSSNTSSNTSTSTGSNGGDRIHIGPLVTHNQAATSSIVVDGALPLAQACLEVGSPALRNRATIVGNVVTASPANDTISALRALDADVEIASVTGTRTVPLGEFHTGVRACVLEANEIVTGLSFPALSGSDQGLYLKLGLRKAQAISVVHIAITHRPSASATRIAIGSVAPTIVTVPEAEAMLAESSPTDWSDELIADAARACEHAVSPIDDLRAPADYRSDEVEVMVRRGLAALRAGVERAAHPTAPPVLGGPSVIDGLGASVGPLDAGDPVTATINGQSVTAAQHGETLLDWLRDAAGFTGTKEGCAEGECGACTVHLGSTAVLSCLVPAGRANGATLTTIEGLAATSDQPLHPLQQAFIDNAAVQCGYCIPGFLMAGAALDDDLDAAQVKLGLSGNLCRCTGYYPIEQAVAIAGRSDGESSTTIEAGA